jgi:hypothetical protein
MSENLIESLQIMISKQQKLIDSLKNLNNIQNNMIDENKKEIKFYSLVSFLIGITFSLSFVILYTILK